MTSFRPTADWNMLRRRAELLGNVRAFFEARGFLEVETPLLSADVVVDRHVEPFVAQPASAAAHEGAAGRWYLQTSPEFAMKRLLAAGGEAIYQVCKAFRAKEQGPRHNIEFTMVEWYRVGDDLAAGMQLLDAFGQVLLTRGPAERISYRDAFLQYAEVDPLEGSLAELKAAAERRQIEVPTSFGNDRDAWLDLLLVECVEPNLGQTRPAIVYDYPPSQAALARVRDDVPPVAERFELYVDGMELANGYHELLDAEVLLERNRRNNALRVADGKAALPEESRLLEAMRAGMPSCCGVALGFDRLAMVATGAKTLAEVMAFTQERA